MITIHLQAKGYTKDGYDVVYKNDTISISKDTTALSLTMRDCKLILEHVLVSLQQFQKFFALDTVADKEYQNNRLEEFQFRANYSSTTKEQVWKEKDFFEEAVQYASLLPLIDQYIKKAAYGEEGARIWMPEGDDYTSHPVGTYAMLALVYQDQAWIPEYIQFLRTSDLEQEVEQHWHIKAIIDTYGWSTYTVQLAIARAISCCGQGGQLQFEQLAEAGLKKYIKKPSHYKECMDKIREEFRAGMEQPAKSRGEGRNAI